MEHARRLLALPGRQVSSTITVHSDETVAAWVRNTVTGWEAFLTNPNDHQQTEAPRYGHGATAQDAVAQAFEEVSEVVRSEPDDLMF